MPVFTSFIFAAPFSKVKRTTSPFSPVLWASTNRLLSVYLRCRNRRLYPSLCPCSLRGRRGRAWSPPRAAPTTHWLWSSSQFLRRWGDRDGKDSDCRPLLNRHKTCAKFFHA